jgi:hypothetical protein
MELHLFFAVGRPKQIGSLHEEAVIETPTGNLDSKIASTVG